MWKWLEMYKFWFRWEKVPWKFRVLKPSSIFFFVVMISWAFYGKQLLQHTSIYSKALKFKKLWWKTWLFKNLTILQPGWTNVILNVHCPFIISTRNVIHNFKHSARILCSKSHSKHQRSHCIVFFNHIFLIKNTFGVQILTRMFHLYSLNVISDEAKHCNSLERLWKLVCVKPWQALFFVCVSNIHSSSQTWLHSPLCPSHSLWSWGRGARARAICVT